MYDPTDAIQPGDPVSAERIEERLRRVSMSFGGSIPYYEDDEGILITDIPGGGGGDTLDLYELTADMVLDDDWREFKCEGKPVTVVWCIIDGDGHYEADAVLDEDGEYPEGAVQRYRRKDKNADGSDVPPEVLWLPTAFRGKNDHQEAEGLKSYKTGQRVYVATRGTRSLWCLVDYDGKYLGPADMPPDPENPPLGTALLARSVLEIVSPPLDVWRFELKTALDPNVRSATAYLLEWTGAGYEINEDVEFTVYDGHICARGWAHTTELQGTVGYVKYFPDSNHWEIISIEHLPEWIEVTLTEDMGYTLEDYAACTVDNYFRGGCRDPTTVLGAISVFDSQGRFFHALSGAKGKATYDQWRNKYVLVKCDVKATSVNVTLTEDMGETVAGEASATVDNWYKGQNPGATCTVTDPQGLFPRALSGAKGKARFTGDDYDLVECQQMADTIRFKSYTATPAGTGNITVASGSVKVMQPFTGQTPVTGNAAYDPVVQGINNLWGVPSDADAFGMAWWNEADTQWEGWCISAKAGPNVTDVRYDSYTKKFEAKVSEITVLYEDAEAGELGQGAGAPETWELIHQCVPLSAVSDIDYGPAGFEHKFVGKYRDAYVIEATGEGAWIPWHDAVDVLPITDLQYDTSDHKFEEKTTKNWVLEKDDEGAWVPWYTTIEVNIVESVDYAAHKFTSQIHSLSRVMEAPAKAPDDWHTAVDVDIVTSLAYNTADHKFKKKTTKGYMLEKDAETGWGSGWYTTIAIQSVNDLSLQTGWISTMDQNYRVMEEGALTGDWDTQIQTTECP